MPITFDEREVLESPKIQGTWEKRAYDFNFADMGIANLASPTAVVLLEGIDVTAIVMPSGAATLNGFVVTTPLLQNLTDGAVYWVYGRVNHDSTQRSELFCIVIGQT